MNDGRVGAVWPAFSAHAKRARSACAALALAAMACAAADRTARAEADGPDYFRVAGVKPDDVLNVRAEPSANARRIGAIQPDGDGVKNLGCRGGLTFADWRKATPAQRAAAQKKRWCRVSWRGVEGWVAARFLVEGAAPR